MSGPKIQRDRGPNGGDRLDVKSGGEVRIFSAGASGGKLTPSSGTQAAHIANRTAATATGGASATALNSTVASLASGVNSLLAALRGVGVLATS